VQRVEVLERLQAKVDMMKEKKEQIKEIRKAYE
jgi:hypothetical protein